MMTEERERTRLLGARNIADACGVSASTVYGWLRNHPDFPRPLYEVTGPLDESGERKTSPAWGQEQLAAIMDWHRRRKG